MSSLSARTPCTNRVSALATRASVETETSACSWMSVWRFANEWFVTVGRRRHSAGDARNALDAAETRCADQIRRVDSGRSTAACVLSRAACGQVAAGGDSRTLACCQSRVFASPSILEGVRAPNRENVDYEAAASCLALRDQASRRLDHPKDAKDACLTPSARHIVSAYSDAAARERSHLVAC